MITFVIFSFVSLHHLITMERYLLNEAVLQKHLELDNQNDSDESKKKKIVESDQEMKTFGYFEVFKHKFLFCCLKKNTRSEQYKQLQKVLEERLDAQNIMINSGNISFLSGTILKPYQMALVQNLQKTSLTMDIKSTFVPSLSNAAEKLRKNLTSEKKNILKCKIDEYLCKIIIDQRSTSSSLRSTLNDSESLTNSPNFELGSNPNQ